MIDKILHRLGLVRRKDVLAIIQRDREICDRASLRAKTDEDKIRHNGHRDEMDYIDDQIRSIGE